MQRVATEYRRAIDHAAQAFPRLRSVLLRSDPRIENGKPRDMAYCEGNTRTSTIFVAPRLERAQTTQIRGVLWHELGHAIDFLYPRGQIEHVLHVKLPAGAERRADVIARAVFGWPICYGPGHLQQAGPGAVGKKKRPKTLPK